MPPVFAAHRISAVVPCYDEEACLPRAYEEISAALACFGDYEILFVDDGSRDRTLDIIKGFAARDPRVRYLSFSRNFGLEAAFSAGFRYARHAWIAQFDADLQSPPHEVTRLFAKALEGYDAVFAERIDRRDPAHRRLGSWLHGVIAARVLGIEVPHRGSIFRVLRTSVARKITEIDLGIPYFLATVPLVGATYTSVPTTHRARVAGESKWRLRQLLAHTMDLYVGFSTRPLIGALVCMLVALTALLAAVVGGVVPQAWVPAAMLTGHVALALGVAALAPYVVRLIRSQNRSVSLYLVREANVEILPADSLYEHDVEPARRTWEGPPPAPVDGGRVVRQAVGSPT